MAKIKIQEKAEEIRRIINSAIAKKLSFGFEAAGLEILGPLKIFLIKIFSGTREYSSLVSRYGSLRAAFGLSFNSAKYTVDKILDDLFSTIELKYATLVGNAKGIDGTLFIGISRVDHADVDFGLGSFIDEHGHFVDWLNWLLFAGNESVVLGWDIKFGKFPRQRSRSQIAIMVPDEGGGWSVPSEFAGTYGNNWITRTIKGNSTAIIDFIQTNFEKEFKNRIK